MSQACPLSLCAHRRRLTACLALVAIGCMSTAITAQEAPVAAGSLSSLFESRLLDASIPDPASIIGHPIGATAVRYEPLVRYLRALAEASDRVTMHPYADSHEKRTLY